MNKSLISIALLTILMIRAADAEDTTIKEDAKAVGHKAGEVVHEVGEAGKEAGKKVVEVARDVGHATRDGAKEFHQAVTGKSNKSKKKSTAHASSSAGSK